MVKSIKLTKIASVFLVSALTTVSGCAVFSSDHRAKDPSLVDSVKTRPFPWISKSPAAVVTTNSGRTSTVFGYGAGGEISYFCKQPAPRTSTEILDAYSNALAASLSEASDETTKNKNILFSSGLQSIFQSGGFELTTPTSIQYAEVGLSTICEYTQNLGDILDPSDIWRLFAMVTNNSMRIALEEQKVAFEKAGNIDVNFNIQVSSDDDVTSKIEQVGNILKQLEDGVSIEDIVGKAAAEKAAAEKAAAEKAAAEKAAAEKAAAGVAVPVPSQ